MHVIFDGRPKPEIKAETISNWLFHAPKHLGFQRISLPMVHCQPPILAGMVFLAESHISVHVDLQAQAMWVDVFTCRAMEEIFVRQEVQRLPFDIERVLVLKRGLEYYPEQVQQVSNDNDAA